MKSLKNHLSVIIPLFVLLFSLQFTFLTNKIVENYSAKLTKDYSIVVVSKKVLSQAIVKSRVNGIKSITEISSQEMLDRLKGNISSKNIALLKIALPKFYSVKLDSFPSTKEIQRIKKKLLASGLVTKVETFSKTHNKIYRMFQALKTTASIFSIFILIISILLMFKQMNIWMFEHKERIAIMTLFGAPFWMKSAVLYRLVLVDSFISTALVATAFTILPHLEKIKSFEQSISVVVPEFDMLKDVGILLSVAVAVSLTIVSIVITKMNKE